MKQLSYLFIGVLLFSGAAQANGFFGKRFDTTIAAGGVYGGATQSSTTCYVFNAGPDAIQIKSFEIIEQNVPGDTKDFDFCPPGTVLQPGETCTITATGLPQQAHSCLARYRGSWRSQVRGTMDVRASGNEVLVNAELR
ncbi:MAG: hypothetical protein ACPGUF_01705 [Litorivicinus sp.]